MLINMVYITPQEGMGGWWLVLWVGARRDGEGLPCAGLRGDEA